MVTAKLMKMSLMEAAGSADCFLFTIWCCSNPVNKLSTFIWSVGICVESSLSMKLSNKITKEFMPLQKPMSEYDTSMQQCNAAGGEVQVEWGSIHEWQNAQGN